MILLYIACTFFCLLTFCTNAIGANTIWEYELSNSVSAKCKQTEYGRDYPWTQWTRKPPIHVVAFILAPITIPNPLTFNFKVTGPHVIWGAHRLLPAYYQMKFQAAKGLGAHCLYPDIPCRCFPPCNCNPIVYGLYLRYLRIPRCDPLECTV